MASFDQKARYQEYKKLRKTAQCVALPNARVRASSTPFVICLTSVKELNLLDTVFGSE